MSQYNQILGVKLILLTIGFGHGVAVSLLQVAAAYATLANGGRKIEPTLLLRRDLKKSKVVMSVEASEKSPSIVETGCYFWDRKKW